MKTNPLVSVIIPVYNDAEYLHESLDSVVNQTLKDIEIIVVNDGSTDNSLEIMNEYAAKDSRVRVINKPENGSALMARKDGIAAATGDYTMFLDGDDRYAPNACETAYNLIEQNNVDILCFSFNFLKYTEGGRIKETTIRHQIFDKILNGREEIQSCYFVERKAYVAYWNKIYKSELLKTAYRSMDDFRCSIFDDTYEDFYISYYATTMLGIPTEPLYDYCEGRGTWGDNKISLQTLTKACHGIQGATLIRNFLEREGTLNEEEKILSVYEHHVIAEALCGTLFARKIKNEDVEEATKILASYLMEWSDSERTTRYLLIELRRKINWANDLVKTRDWLRKQIEVKDARIEELHGWCEEQDKAKQWFLSQIAYKDALIAELEGNTGLLGKLRILKMKAKNLLKRIARKVSRILRKGK